MRLHDGLRDGQAQPGAVALALRVAAVGFGAVKALEQARQRFGGNRRAVVAHAQHDLAIARRDRYVDGATARRVAQRVGQQVADGAAQHQRIAQHGAVALQAQRDAAVFGQGFIKVEQRAHLGAQRHRLARGQQLAMLGLRQKQHVGHGARQAFQLFGVAGQHLAVGGGVARLGQRHVRLRHQVGQRRAQLVRDVGRIGGQAGKRAFQPRQHGVERGGQLGQLDGRFLHRHARVQLARADAFGLGAHQQQRAQAAPHHPAAQQRAGQRGQQHVANQRAAKAGGESLMVANVQRHRHRQRRGAGHGQRHHHRAAAPGVAALAPGDQRGRRRRGGVRHQRGGHLRLAVLLEQRLRVRALHTHRQILLRAEGGAQVGGQGGQRAGVVHPRQQVARLLQVRLQDVAVLRLKVQVQRQQRHAAQQRQRRAGDQGKQQREPGAERCARRARRGGALRVHGWRGASSST